MASPRAFVYALLIASTLTCAASALETAVVSPSVACVTLWSPVCGIDGKTYSNECFAAQAGVPVAYKGECKTSVQCLYEDQAAEKGCKKTNAICACTLECRFNPATGECMPKYCYECPSATPKPSPPGTCNYPNQCMDKTSAEKRGCKLVYAASNCQMLGSEQTYCYECPTATPEQVPVPPKCGRIGTESEGWYDQTGLIKLDKCAGCEAKCSAIGTRSEGWYSSCTDKLIRYDNCGETVVQPTPLLPPGGEETFTINFAQGWNMFSVPFMKFVVEKTNCGSEQPVWHYDPKSRQYQKNWIPQNGFGYWVKMPFPCSMTFSGSAPATLEGIRLYAGWNQVGAPGGKTACKKQCPLVKTCIAGQPCLEVECQTICSGSGGTWDSMKGNCRLTSGPWSYNPLTKQYEKAASLEAGKGYWVKVEADCTLSEETLPLPPGGETCSEKCASMGYENSRCNSYPIAFGPDVEQPCAAYETNIGQTTDCRPAENIVGTGFACCCSK